MYNYNARLLRVIDGDTVDVELDLGFDIKTKKRLRLAEINTPECRTKDLKEKEKGLAAKKRVKDILEENESFEIESTKLGKYGRVLAKIYIVTMDGKQGITKKCLNDILLSEGHAIPYFGGKK